MDTVVCTHCGRTHFVETQLTGTMCGETSARIAAATVANSTKLKELASVLWSKTGGATRGSAGSTIDTVKACLALLDHQTTDYRIPGKAMGPVLRETASSFHSFPLLVLCQGAKYNHWVVVVGRNKVLFGTDTFCVSDPADGQIHLMTGNKTGDISYTSKDATVLRLSSMALRITK